MVKLEVLNDLVETVKGLGASRALVNEPPPGNAPKGH
jgi:hypothetical protein